MTTLNSPFPLLPLRTGVVFPGSVIPLPVGRKSSVALVKTLKPGDIIGVAVQRDRRIEDPSRADLYDIGTVARVHRITATNERMYRLVIEGLDRLEVGDVVRNSPFLLAEGEIADDVVGDDKEVQLLADALRKRISELAAESGGALAQAVKKTRGSPPGLLADRVAAALGLEPEQELEILHSRDLIERLRLVARLVNEADALAGMKRKIDAEVRKELSKNQREALLRQQMRAIQRQLGDGEEEDEIDELERRLDEAELPEEAAKVAEAQLKRLRSLNPGQPEHNVVRTYLELIADLPWSKRTEVHDDIDRVEQKLDEDHFGLDDVKERILQHLAVLKLSGNTRGTILCLAGPPGVGKTSLGQSIADATGRPFRRISLGGVRDEAEIRGHRRTYVGALPGRIIHALKKAGAKNPVLLLDEIDKLGRGWGGIPEAALLEVLDPEQNATFTDNYLEIPFDLSEVLFICTANQLSEMSGPLRDRLDIIEVSGYTPEEKVEIARRHLLPEQLTDHGLAEDHLQVSDEGLLALISNYTREAGVRQLKRELGRVCRSLALKVARNPDSKPETVLLEDDGLTDLLGKKKFFNEVAERTSIPGVATGLAWTPVGGDILFIETSRMPGKGKVDVTGQLGDVMKESSRAALTYVRSHAEELGVEPDFLERFDLHIHVPAGAVPKDGPSAGVTMFTALTSLLTDRQVRSDTAMTGECTLRGRVLPVGGIKAKVLAAHRAGLTRVILPERNRRDVDDVPEAVRDQMEFIFAEDMSQVLAQALTPDPIDGADPIDIVAEAPQGDDSPNVVI